MGDKITDLIPNMVQVDQKLNQLTRSLSLIGGK